MNAISPISISAVLGDDRLLADIRRFIKDEKEMARLENLKPLGHDTHDEIDRIMKRNWKRLRRIILEPANTQEGIKMKALALRAFTVDPPDASPFREWEGPDLEVGLIGSILRDLVRGAGA